MPRAYKDGNRTIRYEIKNATMKIKSAWSISPISGPARLGVGLHRFRVMSSLGKVPPNTDAGGGNVLQSVPIAFARLDLTLKAGQIRARNLARRVAHGAPVAEEVVVA
jgi:hypothetical protein